MNPKGGSEILYENLIKHVGHCWPTDVNLVLSTCNNALVDRAKKNVIWQHLSYDQQGVQELSNPDFVKLVDRFVFVSNWQRTEFLNRFELPTKSSVVIKNAITPIEYKEKPKDRLKIIYTSMPNRGLEILLDALSLINRTDIEVDIYSSNILYGSAYSQQVAGSWDRLFHRCKTTPYINYKGFAFNLAVRKALQSAHILAYPSIFEETSCLAAIEALAAGCKVVTTNLAALPETCGNWASYVNYTPNYRQLTEDYARVLSDEIDNYWKNDSLKEQSNWYNANYSWDNRKLEWIDFIKNI